MVVGAGLILGPILGGWLTGFGWQTVFWFNVPIGLIGTAAAATLLVEQGRRAPRAGLDLAGSALYLVGLTGLVTALAFGGIYGWTTRLGPRRRSRRSSSRPPRSCGSRRITRRRSSTSTCSATGCSPSAT